ncbi:MAG: prolyl oligopeptidase family serine peptidase [Opitutales bacterium]
MALLFQACATPTPPLSYPPARTTSQVDVYHGVKVADPYRWLEDDNSPETAAWVAAENKVTYAFLDAIPQRNAIKQRLTQLWNFERYAVPFKRGERYFFEKNDGLQNQSVLYTLTSLDAQPTVLLDPNLLSADGTVALADFVVSDDGNLMAYGLSTSGSDWQEWKFRDIRTGQDLPDRLEWVKFSEPCWSKDGSGIYYSRFDAPAPGSQLTGVNKFHKLYYHRLGTPQSDDQLIYQRPDHDDWGFDSIVTDDGHYLIINVTVGSDQRNRVFYLDLAKPGSPVVELLNDFDASYAFLGNNGPVFWFQTNLNAPRGRVIAIDTADPARDNWRTLVPQANATLDSATVLNHSFVCSYLADAHSQVKIFSLNGTFLREIALPGLGSVDGFTGRPRDTETFYSYTSFTTPGTIYHYDLPTGTSTVFRQPKVDFNPDDFETTQVFFTSKDGTRVPMFITAKKGLQLDGSNPTLLYGYGGFDISLTPRFSVSKLVWMEMGGVYVMVNLRGGGEYGEDWHQAGMKLHKQNVFDDYIAAAEWLIAHHYTSTSRLAISGASNGGLLVGACLTQRPDLYGATLPDVGVMDMLRFNQFTIGWAWMSDYGSPDNPDEFKALYAYSPLHNIHPGTKYPATLITTADHDDRVVPAHSFKFAATLQADQAGPAPILIRIETKSGHGGGRPTSKLIDESTDQWAFLVKELNMQLPNDFENP